MSFTERPWSKMDERAPLIENPIVWTRSYEHPLKNAQFTERAERKERFQWLVFGGVSLVSLLLLLTTIGFVMRNIDTNIKPSIIPRPLIPLPTSNPSAPGVVAFSTTVPTTTTTVPTTTTTTPTTTTTTPTTTTTTPTTTTTTGSPVVNVLPNNSST